MRVLGSILAVIALVLPAVPQGPPPEPEVKVDHLRAYREESRILIDGAVVVNRPNGLRGLRVVFEILAPGEKLISLQESRLTRNRLDAGAEVPFYFQFADHSRAVYVKVDVRDGGNVVLTVDKPGPYPIE